MKTSWIVGSVITGHIAAASFLLMQGCQTAQSGRRGTLLGGHTEGGETIQTPPSARAPALPATPTVPGTAQFAPDGRPIKHVGEVGKPGTFKEVVVPAGAAAPKPVVTTPAPVKITPPPLPKAGGTYTVAKGDTLGHIAQRHGVTTRDLIRLNNINDPNKLVVGQKISIPSGSKAKEAPASVKAPAGGTTHKVVSGESVSVIAQKYGVRTADVLAANKLSRDSVIRVNQVLVIPGASAPKAVAVKDAPAKAPAPKIEPSPVKTTDAPVKPAGEPAKSGLDVQPIPLPTPSASEKAAPAGGDAHKTYVVKENEDIFSVAVKWGCTPTQLRQLNNLTSSELTAGQVLRIPED